MKIAAIKTRVGSVRRLNSKNSHNSTQILIIPHNLSYKRFLLNSTRNDDFRINNILFDYAIEHT